MTIIGRPVNPCNYCVLRHFEQRLRPGHKLIKGVERMGPREWTTVYSVPERTDEAAFWKRKRGGRQEWLLVSFLELTDHCVC